jgi:hypothetical protein
MVRDSNQAATAHGVLYIIATLAVAPVDTLIAGACRRWSWLHGFTGTMYFLFVVGAMVPGIMISREHVVVSKQSLFIPASSGVFRGLGAHVGEYYYRPSNSAPDIRSLVC